jgi:hypothetical protein
MIHSSTHLTLDCARYREIGSLLGLFLFFVGAGAVHFHVRRHDTNSNWPLNDP